jgi:mRNA interferase MazF
MKRGDVVVVAPPGEYGKPRPALVVQTDGLQNFETVSMALITTTLREAPETRPAIQPSPGNGLRLPSEVMVDKIQPIKHSRIGPVIGTLSGADMDRVTRSLAVFFGIAD